MKPTPDFNPSGGNPGGYISEQDTGSDAGCGTGGTCNLFYFASPGARPPVAFELVESGERRAVFENKQHDFPQRILYWLDTAGAMHARIEGPQAGNTVSEEWVWTKTR